MPLKPSTLLAFAVMVASSAKASAPAAGEVVMMAPVKVEDYSMFLGYFLRVHWSATDGTVQDVRVTKIENGSLAEKAGLRNRDYFISIDGVPVAGRSKTEFLASMRKRAEPDHPAIYAFAIERGFLFKRRLTVNLIVKSNTTRWTGIHPVQEEALETSDPIPSRLAGAHPPP